MKDSKNTLLLLVSIGLIGTWVYHFYDKSHYTDHPFRVLANDTSMIREPIKDSLEKLFNEKTIALDTMKVAEDSLRNTLDSSIEKIYSLRNQINEILKNRGVTTKDLKKARELIEEYKEKIEEMRAKNDDLETEREGLSEVLSQLNTEMKDLQDNIQKITEQNKELTETINEASTFVASDLNLSAVTLRPGKRETEALTARKANKFIFSFTLQNNIAKTDFYDVYVVITQPDDKVLQNDIWGAGADYFVSKSEGNKAYTAKVHFDYNKGEKKKLLYTIQPDNFLSGTYKFEVYQNGVGLGETTKHLD
jgi:myosin heavy subunit